MMKFNAPIPGQSLTTPPGNYPWEQPPKTEDPNEAVRLHIKKLSSPESMVSLIDLMEIGFPVRALTESALTSAVMNGIHSIDVSSIIAPVIFEQIKTIGDEAGVDYDLGFDENTEEKEARDRQVLQMKVRRMINKGKGKAKEVMTDALNVLDTPESEYTQQEAPMKDITPMEAAAPMEDPTAAPMEVTNETTPVPAPDVARKGLMARGV